MNLNSAGSPGNVQILITLWLSLLSRSQSFWVTFVEGTCWENICQSVYSDNCNITMSWWEGGYLHPLCLYGWRNKKKKYTIGPWPAFSLGSHSCVVVMGNTPHVHIRALCWQFYMAPQQIKTMNLHSGAIMHGNILLCIAVWCVFLCIGSPIKV